MRSRAASCACGNVRLDCAGEPVRVSMCLCLACQRRTGSVMSIAAFYPRAAVRVHGGDGLRTWTRPSDSGFPVTFHFCTSCGTNIFWEPARLPDLIGVAVGAFGDPAFPMAEQVVWAQSRATWLHLPETMTSYATSSPARTRPVIGSESG